MELASPTSSSDRDRQDAGWRITARGSSASLLVRYMACITKTRPAIATFVRTCFEFQSFVFRGCHRQTYEPKRSYSPIAHCELVRLVLRLGGHTFKSEEHFISRNFWLNRPNFREAQETYEAAHVCFTPSLFEAGTLLSVKHSLGGAWCRAKQQHEPEKRCVWGRSTDRQTTRTVKLVAV